MPSTKPNPNVIPAAPYVPGARTRLTAFAILAAHRSTFPFGHALTDADAWTLDGVTHVVRARTASEAARLVIEETGGILNHASAGALHWPDDDRSARLLVIARVDDLLTLRAEKLTGEPPVTVAAVERPDGAPFRVFIV